MNRFRIADHSNRTRTALLSASLCLSLLAPIYTSASSVQGMDSQRPDLHADQLREELWRFQVEIDDRVVGNHEFLVTSSHNVQKISSNARFNVKLLFVTVFDYVHTNTEQWQSNCLDQIESETKMNRKNFAVSGQRQEDNFVASTADEYSLLPACIQTFAYWNPSILQADKLMNAQTGKLENVRIQALGQEPFEVAGRQVTAEKYRIALDKGHIDVWYRSGDPVWLGLQTLTGDGNLVRYVPLQTPLSEGLTTHAQTI